MISIKYHKEIMTELRNIKAKLNKLVNDISYNTFLIEKLGEASNIRSNQIADLTQEIEELKERLNYCHSYINALKQNNTLSKLADIREVLRELIKTIRENYIDYNEIQFAKDLESLLKKLGEEKDE